ncbi:hypothetical protein VTN00DRAFT_3944 [Thermoascus crustaceus]|uniref:uncharacterized protein n=1 Tax=Thermoascus crustaceus TaxID=5088 RepID=UPI0037434ABB
MAGDNDVEFPPYTPMPSLGHELGIMFGFIMACLLSMLIYFVFWQAAQRSNAIKEQARREELRARGIHHERGGIYDKMMHDRYGRPPGTDNNHLEPPTRQGIGRDSPGMDRSATLTRTSVDWFTGGAGAEWSRDLT